MNSFSSGRLPRNVSVWPREVVYHVCEQYSKEPLAKQTIRCGIVPLAKSDRCNNNPGIAISDWNSVHNYLNKFNRKNIFSNRWRLSIPKVFLFNTFFWTQEDDIPPNVILKSMKFYTHTHAQTTYKF